MLELVPQPNIPMSLAPFQTHLQKIRPKIQSYSVIQQQVLQGFYYGVCSALTNKDVVGDVDHILGYAGESFVKHYRSDCAVFHADFAHLAAVVPEAVAEDELYTYAGIFQSIFTETVPAPYNNVFQRLADGEEFGVEALGQGQVQASVPPSVQTKPRERVSVARLRKTMKRRRGTSPPPKVSSQ
jgi:hypothetical protein